jgi:antitoxin MazE
MHSQVQKWGNILGIRIPKTIAQKLHLHSGYHVELDMINQSIVITKLNLELDLLLERIDSTNCHHENFTDDSNVGNE